MGVDLMVLLEQFVDVITIKKLLKKRSADAKEVADFTKKYGLGTPEWQNAMMKRVKEKIKNKKKLTEIDKKFMHLQTIHNMWVEDQLKSMGVRSTCMN